jgi:hypothetical protein
MKASPISSDFAFAPSSGLGEFARQYNLGAVTGKESELIVKIAVQSGFARRTQIRPAR